MKQCTQRERKVFCRLCGRIWENIPRYTILNLEHKILLQLNQRSSSLINANRKKYSCVVDQLLILFRIAAQLSKDSSKLTEEFYKNRNATLEKFRKPTDPSIIPKPPISSKGLHTVKNLKLGNKNLSW